MKKIILFACALALVASCSKNETDTGTTPDGKITFIPRVALNGSKATSGPLDLIGLQGSDDGFAVSTDGLGGTGEMDNVVVKYVADAWVYTGDYFWPLNPTESVNFCAYAPAGTTGVTMTGTDITVVGFLPASDPASQIDLIYAAPASFNRTGSGTTGVSLTFAHLLTQVVFSVTTDIALEASPVINSIAVTVPAATGDYDETGWTVSGSSQTYTLFDDTELSSTAVTSTPLLMIPQTLAAATTAVITFTVNGAEYVNTVDLSTLPVVDSWAPGTKVTYSLAFNSADLKIKFADPAVTDWTNATDEIKY